MEIVKQIQYWLRNDQLSFGEWGKSEISNATESPRTILQSKLKPNIFASTQAIYTLISTGYDDQNVFNNFLKWLNEIRTEDGYWTSAGGRNAPNGDDNSYDRIKNIRHCAKGLDILLLFNKTSPEDQKIYDFILRQQFNNGAFPQFPESEENIWSTAYVINLLIRSIFDENITKFSSRNYNEKSWKAHIQTKIDQAFYWLCSQRDVDELWHAKDEKTPIWTTEAMLAEIGGYLSIKRPDVCNIIANKILENQESLREVSLWSLAIIFPTLSPDMQKQVKNLIMEFINKPSYSPEKVFESSCACRLFYIGEYIEVLNYYLQESNGHETALRKVNKWEVEPYQIWCIKTALNKINTGELLMNITPNNKIEAWQSILYIINLVKKNIESNRGWELLWNGNKHRDEKSFQVLFFNQIKAYHNNLGIIIREPETGSGSVDFEFNNGYKVRLYIEIKLSNNPNYTDGLKLQLKQYLKSESVDSGIYVFVGFEDSDQEKFKEVERENLIIREMEPELFIETVYIDASRKVSASKLH